MTNWTGPRAEAYRVDAISRDGRLTTLDDVKDGSLDWSVFRKIRGGGSITLVNPPDLDWLSTQIRVLYQYQAGRDVGQLPLGTYVVSKVDTKQTSIGLTVKLSLLDMVTLLVEDATIGAVSIPAGANITDAVKAQIAAATPTLAAVTDSDATLHTGMAWPAGTSRLTIVNDLLDAINYYAIWADETGTLRAEPYMPPTQRTVSWRFDADATSIISTTIDDDIDLQSIPNRIVCTTSETQNTPALVGIAENNDPSSPYSYAARGRWITHRHTGVEAADQTTINEMAARRLEEAMQIVHRATIRYLWVPLALHENAQLPDGTVMSLVERKIKLSPGALVEGTLRRIETV